MTIILEPEPVTGIRRGRGGFMRGGANGDTPWVTDPTGALVKSGHRKGLPKRTAYGAMSSRGQQIENTFNLAKWGERRLALGVALDPDIYATCRDLIGLDPDSSDFKTVADAIVVAAKEAAQASLAADRGTHAHALAEDVDAGRDPIERLVVGEVLGISAEAQAGLVVAWNEMLEREGLEVLASEASCVDDAWRCAGTLDRIVRTTRALRFVDIFGETIEVPAGTVVVLDIKSGRLRRTISNAVQYWQSYSVQIASYAQSVPYDTELEQRGVWPWPINQEHALIAHLDVEAAIAGEPSCTLIHVDLVAGRYAGDLCVEARAWDALNTSRSTTFSVAQLGDDQSAVCDLPPQTATAGEDQTPSPADNRRRSMLLDRYRRMSDTDRQRYRALAVDRDDLDAVEAALDRIDPFAALIPRDTRPLNITLNHQHSKEGTRWESPSTPPPTRPSTRPSSHGNQDIGSMSPSSTS